MRGVFVLNTLLGLFCKKGDLFGAVETESTASKLLAMHSDARKYNNSCIESTHVLTFDTAPCLSLARASALDSHSASGYLPAWNNLSLKANFRPSKVQEGNFDKLFVDYNTTTQ